MPWQWFEVLAKRVSKISARIQRFESELFAMGATCTGICFGTLITD